MKLDCDDLLTTAGEGALAGGLSGPIDRPACVLATILGVDAQDLQRRVPEVERGAEPVGTRRGGGSSVGMSTQAASPRGGPGDAGISSDQRQSDFSRAMNFGRGASSSHLLVSTEGTIAVMRFSTAIS